MADGDPTHIITEVSPTIVTPTPNNGIRTEVIENADGSWSFILTYVFLGREQGKKCDNVFSSRDEAEQARSEFRESERKKMRQDFFVE